MPYLAKFVMSQESVEQSTWLTDLELMHHYTSSTYMTLPRPEELHQLWQVEVPKVAMSHIYLLHQVLSISAHHLASSNPNRPEHSICASQHQNEAIKGLRTALKSITEETCVEVFIASTLLSIGAFAGFSTQKIQQQPRIDDLLDVFVLLRGMKDILERFQATLHNSIIGAFFMKSHIIKPTPVLIHTLAQLQEMTTPDDMDDEIAMLCRDSLTATVAWFQNSISITRRPEARIGMTWCLCVSPEFLDLIRRRHSFALCVVAYYCVILDHAGKSTWYMRGWGAAILQDIANEVEPEWAEVVQWCLTAVQTNSTLEAAHP
ncbi:hypothetical protein F66182_4402 [Fusarium sp. NRRL 66182]|nr:hypothetical protein F66182_4402 [Fusarium sp. NRRL 66182]